MVKFYVTLNNNNIYVEPDREMGMFSVCVSAPEALELKIQLNIDQSPLHFYLYHSTTLKDDNEISIILQ